MVFTALSRALGQLSDPRFRRVVLYGVGITLLAFLALWIAVFWGIGWLIGDGITLPWIGTLTWSSSLLSWGSVVLMVIGSVFVMGPVAIAVQSLFLDQVASAVEDKHYPLAKGRPAPFATAMADGLRALCVLIFANLIALVFYLASGPFAPLVFYGLNGFLLGREYTQVSALRHMPRADARRLRRKHLPVIWGAGVVMAVPLTIPIMNLFVPVLGAATFTHLFHSLAGSGPLAAAEDRHR